jgi:cytochrome P450
MSVETTEPSRRDDVPDYPFTAPTPLEPPAELADLRAQCPMSRIRLASGDEALLATRHQDVRQLLSDPRFTRMLTAEGAARITAHESGGAFGNEQSVTSLLGPDGHQRWRRLVGRAFTAKRMGNMQPWIESLAHELLDAMQAEGRRTGHLSAGFAFPLTIGVICKLLGVPAEDRHRFSQWADARLSVTKYTQEEVDRANAEYTEYFTAHIAARRAAPGDDLISELIETVDSQDGRLSEQELLATGMGLLIAGHETTSNMIVKMTAMLLADRRRWEELLADRALVRTAVEEALRFDPLTGFGMPRYISEDVELESGGGTVRAGQTVICSMTAANHDDRAFERADEMDLRRAPNQHLAFGAGPYSCLGQSLARTELQTALRVLLDRLPDLDFDVPVSDLRRREGLLVGGLQELPVRW